MEQTTKKVEKQKETVKEKKVYTQEEAYSSSLNYFKGDELAARVWVSKYALKDSYGNIFELNPDDMHHRLASEIARIERNYMNPMSEEQIFEVLRDFKYIVPQGGPMTGIGNDYQIASLSNCFVIGHDGPSDSYGGVMKIDQEQVQLMKRRGGVGHDLSHIRPKGEKLSLDIYWNSSFHGALFEFDPGGRTRWSAGSVDVECFHQSPGFRKFH